MIRRTPSTHYASSLVSLAVLVIATVTMSACNSDAEGERDSSNTGYSAAPDTNSQKSTSNGDSTKTNSTAATSNSTNNNSTSGQPATATTKPSTSQPIPEGNAQQLLAFIDRLNKQPLQGNSEQEAIANLQKTQRTINEAATKLLTMELSDEDRKKAVEAKLGSIAVMMQIGVKGMDQQMLQFGEQLSREKNAELAFLGKKLLFSSKINDIQTGTNTDFATFAEQTRKLLDGHENDEDVFLLSQQACLSLANVDQGELSNQLFTDVGKAFAASKNPRLAEEAQNILQQTLFFNLKIKEKVAAAIQGEDGAKEALFEGIQTILDLETVGQAAFRNISELATQFEAAQQIDVAQEIYRRLGERFKAHADKTLSEEVLKAVSNGTVRASLVGKPYELTGVTNDNTPLDWSQYKGKVVFIDFWATWCLPCLQELPNVLAQHKKYHDQGLEVIGVNLDEEPQQIKQFLDRAPIPWATIVTANEKTTGFESPIAVKNGIDQIPFTVLIARDGTVAAINLRGAELESMLAKMFEEEDPPADDPPAKKAPSNEDQSFQFPSFQPRGGIGLVAVAGHFFAAGDDKTLKSAPKSDDDATDKQPAADNEPSNPYLAAAGLSAFELVDFILDMQEKPLSIRKRPGFADAVSEAADRVLKSTKSDKLQVLATLGKFTVLHERASFGDQQADEKLVAFLKIMKDDKREKIAQEVRFLQLERKLLEVDELPLEQVPGLLEEVKKYLADQKLTEKHLRLASSTVHSINRLEDEKQRESYFTEFGGIFSKSSAKQLAQYGKKLSRKPSGSSSDLVGKPLELAGTTALGTEFDWTQYRGKVVLVDFWATWCAPCRREMPHVKALYEKFKDKGFDVVAVSLDRDLDALAQYLKENNIAWTNLAGDGTQALAQKYGVRGIPTMMLIDQTGKIVDIRHNVAQLAPQIEPLLKGKKPGKTK